MYTNEKRAHKKTISSIFQAISSSFPIEAIINREELSVQTHIDAVVMMPLCDPNTTYYKLCP